VPAALANAAGREALTQQNDQKPDPARPDQVEDRAVLKSGVSALAANGATPPLTLVAITPCRVMDTRAAGSSPWSPFFSANETRTLPIYSGGYALCSGIPSYAQGYSLNFTVLADKGSAVGFLSAWPAGTSWPGNSTLNAYTAGLPVANAAVVPTGTGTYAGEINVFVTNATNVLIDINGYYVSGDIGNTNNTQLGVGALTSNSSGIYNSAFGYNAANAVSSGSYNTGIGESAELIATGSENAAFGAAALFNLTTGDWNTAVGTSAGDVLTSGSYNIYVGSYGMSSESNTIRIGSAANQTAAYIAGVRDAGGSGNIVYVGTDGKIFSLPSSRRFKQDIRDIGDASDVLMELRPVQFRYNFKGQEEDQHYGLIAEEVEDLAPQLVGRDKDGQIDSVYYDKVNALLLNEVQKQHRLIESQKEQLQSLSDAIRQLETRLAELDKHR